MDYVYMPDESVYYDRDLGDEDDGPECLLRRMLAIAAKRLTDEIDQEIAELRDLCGLLPRGDT